MKFFSNGVSRRAVLEAYVSLAKGYDAVVSWVAEGKVPKGRPEQTS